MMLPLLVRNSQGCGWHLLDDRVLPLGDNLQALWVLGPLTWRAGLPR